MSSDLDLRGVYIPIITPFDEGGDVAVDALEQLAAQYLEAGAAGIVALGTTGESAALDADERETVITACSRVCAERDAPLIVGAGTNSTRASLAMIEQLRGVPAVAAALTVVPYYVRPSESGIVEHFHQLAEAAPVPLVVYNIPYRTGRNLSAEAILHLAAESNIAGLKQAVGGIDIDTLRVLAHRPPDFHVLGGEDAYLFPMVLMGASGAIVASAHLCTEHFVSMIDCGLAGKVDEGRAIAETLLPLVEAIFAEPNPAVIKGVLHEQGRIPTIDVRAPLTVASVPAVERCLAAVEAVSS